MEGFWKSSNFAAPPNVAKQRWCWKTKSTPVRCVELSGLCMPIWGSRVESFEFVIHAYVSIMTFVVDDTATTLLRGSLLREASGG